MATSGSFSTNAVGNFYFTFEWSRTGYDSSRNEHYIHYNVYAHNTPGNYRTVYEKNLWVAGAQRYYDTTGRQCYDGTLIASGDLTIPSSNSAGDGSFSAAFAGGVGITPGTNCSGEGSWDLDRIPRYANFTSHYIESTGLNSIKVHWSADAQCDWLQYSLNGGNWADTSGYPTYTINGLAPNTQYSIKTRIRRADSGLWTESGTIQGTTKDIAKITKAPNIIHGNSLKVEYNNPSNSSISIGIWKTDGSTALTGGYRSCSGSSYTFNFTDEELDNIYKQYGRYSNTVTLRVYIKTANNSNYLNYKEFTITLNGNQKTANLYPEENVHKRGKVFIYKNRTPKKAVMWTYESTGWKRGT